ncbi:hypothetical protein MHYP_G00293560 [Metynnis hypsauchen]
MCSSKGAPRDPSSFPQWSSGQRDAALKRALPRLGQSARGEQRRARAKIKRSEREPHTQERQSSARTV